MTATMPEQAPFADTPADPAGAETLEIMAAAPRYGRWQFDAIAGFLGNRVLEVGAGLGGVAAHIAVGRELVVVCDTDPFYRSRLQQRFAGMPNVIVEELTLPGSDWGTLSAHRLDTVVAVNVLEHVKEDVESIRRLSDLVRPSGRLVLLVPAMPVLYGKLDEELGHFRRYTPRSLRRAMLDAGVRAERVFWFNRAGAVPWWLNSRLRRKARVQRAQLRVFDALVPLFRLERFFPVPFGLSLIGVGRPA